MPIRFRLYAIRKSTRGPVACAITLGACLTGWSAAESDCPAPVATCMLPAAARHSDRIATYFHTGGLVIPAAHSEAECAEPIATCIQPAPQRLRLTEVGPARHVEQPATVTELLRDWAEASSAHPAWSPAEKKWLARRHQPWLSAVALDAVMRLSSSVEAQNLAHDFTWTQEATREDVTVLHAVPKDDAQRLFCPQLRVELDATTHALAAIDVADRTGTWRPIDLPWAVLPKPSRGHDTIVLTADRMEVDVTESANLPPKPVSGSTIRFAAERLEFNVTTPR